jgi:hypothetical protein
MTLVEQDELMAKDGFVSTMSHKMQYFNETTRKAEEHPVKFTQWEARYVSHLQYENETLKRELRALQNIITDQARREQDFMKLVVERTEKEKSR